MALEALRHTPCAEPRLLALDTSTEVMAVAVCEGARVSLSNAEGGARASSALIPAALAQLAECGLMVRDLDAVAFGCGPGAFTGLRTACSVAQGLALGAGCPVLAIDSLMIVAEDARLQQAPGGEAIDLGVAMDARMGELYAAAYRWDGAAWHTLEAPALCDPGALAAHWEGTPLAALAGNAGPLLAGEAHWRALARIEAVQDRAAALLRLARASFAAGLGKDAAEALPLYLRDKVALTVAEREARRVAA